MFCIYNTAALLAHTQLMSVNYGQTRSCCALPCTKRAGGNLGNILLTLTKLDIWWQPEKNTGHCWQTACYQKGPCKEKIVTHFGLTVICPTHRQSTMAQMKDAIFSSKHTTAKYRKTHGTSFTFG